MSGSKLGKRMGLRHTFGVLVVLSTVFLLPSGFASAAGGPPSAGQVYSWGVFAGRASGGPIINIPTMVPGNPGSLQQIVASNSDTYMLTSQGTVWAIGSGVNGELGNGTTTVLQTTPVQVHFPAGVVIASLPEPMPFDTGLAIDTQGNVWGWGYNNHGQLCLGSTNQRNTPKQLPLTNVTLATGAGYHAIYYANGTLYACGSDLYGALGDGGTQDEYTPVPITGLPAEPVTALTSSFQDSGVVLADGSYWDWGLNNLGQLGNGNTINSNVPVNITLPNSVSQVEEGGGGPTSGQTFAVLADGRIFAWGADGLGQLCDHGTAAAVTVPEQLNAPANVTWMYVKTGGSASFAVDSSGGLWACGANNNGQIGDGTSNQVVLQPELVLSHVSQISGTAGNVAVIAG